jgi:hypothetical protein
MPADEFIKLIPATPSLMIGTGVESPSGPSDGDDEFKNPYGGLAFVPSRPEWIICTDPMNHRIKMHNAHTGDFICKFGSRGQGNEHFTYPYAVAVTGDSTSPLVLVVDCHNNRVQVLKLCEPELTFEGDRP